MARATVRDRLEHMLDAIAAIERYIDGMSHDDFLADRMRLDAVERNIERLSEASRHVPDALKARHPRIPWQQVADVGNALRHGYAAIDAGEIWNTVTEDLPALKKALEAMMQVVGDDE